MADLIARALGRAALRKADPEREKQKRYNDLRLDDLDTAGMVSVRKLEKINIFGPEISETLLEPIVSHEKRIAEGVERLCSEDLAALIGYYYPELILTGEGLRERLGELIRSDNRLSRLRQKYGWHDAEKTVPNHSRHVLIWTQLGEYRAWYDHVHCCWRTTRCGLKITHWREQCGPESWPVK